MLKQQPDRRMTEWRTRIADYGHAVKWVKASARPPWLLRQANDNVTVGGSKGAQALREAWGRTAAAVRELAQQGLEAAPTVQVVGVSLEGSEGT